MQSKGAEQRERLFVQFTRQPGHTDLTQGLFFFCPLCRRPFGRDAPDGKVVLTLKVWALLRGRWQSTDDAAERIEFMDGPELIHESRGKATTKGFQLVRSDLIRLPADDGETPQLTSWQFRFSDDGELIITDQGTGQVWTYRRVSMP
jgi:hypothetical protein